jgi:hypothetical protein
MSAFFNSIQFKTLYCPNKILNGKFSFPIFFFTHYHSKQLNCSPKTKDCSDKTSIQQNVPMNMPEKKPVTFTAPNAKRRKNIDCS